MVERIDHPSETRHLLEVWGSDQCQVWAAGNHIMKYECGANGSPTVWETVTGLPVLTAAYLGQIWGARSDDIFVTGENGLIMHFNGAPMSSSESVESISGWSQVRSPTTKIIDELTGTDNQEYLYIIDRAERAYRLKRNH